MTTVKEMKQALANLPDDAELVFHHDGDIYTPGEVYQIAERDPVLKLGTVVIDINLDLDRTAEDEEYCDECGAATPDDAEGVMGPWHERSCSCHPDNAI
jgi:hypothetical protein